MPLACPGKALLFKGRVARHHYITKEILLDRDGLSRTAPGGGVRTVVEFWRGDFPLGRAFWLAWHPGAWHDGRAEITGLGHYAPYTTHRLIFNGPAEKPVEVYRDPSSVQLSSQPSTSPRSIAEA